PASSFRRPISFWHSTSWSTALLPTSSCAKRRVVSRREAWQSSRRRSIDTATRRPSAAGSIFSTTWNIYFFLPTPHSRFWLPQWGWRLSACRRIFGWVARFVSSGSHAHETQTSSATHCVGFFQPARLAAHDVRCRGTLLPRRRAAEDGRQGG